jgi:hypothetical protein
MESLFKVPRVGERDRKVAEALSLVMAGNQRAGMALYDEWVRGDFVADLPIALHLLFLERAGRNGECAALRDLAVERGASLVVRANLASADPDELAAEYEALFAQGTGNARMVFDYLKVLSRLGRIDALSSVVDTERLLKISHLSVDPGAVQRALLAEEERSALVEADQSIRSMRKVEGLEHSRDPSVQALLTALEDEAERYRAAWAASDHPLANLIPQKLKMKTWGLISRGEGYNVQHIHPRGWLTGVYYPAAPPDGAPGGELRIGSPAELDGKHEGWPDVTIRPEAGMLVIMPSYYMHWTQPLGRSGLRTSTAFDYRHLPVRV